MSREQKPAASTSSIARGGGSGTAVRPTVDPALHVVPVDAPGGRPDDAKVPAGRDRDRGDRGVRRRRRFLAVPAAARVTTVGALALQEGLPWRLKEVAASEFRYRDQGSNIC